MRTFIRLGLVMVMLILPQAVLAQTPFIIGVAPHTSARIILEMYQPLRLHLEKTLGVPVEIVTAKDFNAFAKSGLAQQYDLAITTGHQARLLELDAKYIPLLTYKADFKAVVLVAAKGPITKPAALRAKRILGLSPASLVTLWGQHWLQENGLGSASVKYVSASDSVAQLIIAGEAEAGFISLANFQTLAPEVQKQIRVLATSKSMVGRVYLLNSSKSAQANLIKSALWAFSGTQEGARYFESNKLGGYKKLKPQDLKSMDQYASEVRKLLQ